MQVKQVQVNNYRNYKNSTVLLSAGKTILIGQNAQGKSNFLEVIEIASRGKSQRTSDDNDLVGWSDATMQMEIIFERGGYEESISYSLKKPYEKQGRSLQRRLLINGVKSTHSQLIGKLVTVTFSSQDLHMLRDGPKYRRQWLDSIIESLTPTYHDVITSYQKIIVQRNRLLKQIFERGKVSVSDQDQLLAWDKQMSRYAARIIKQRMKLLANLLPIAETYQAHFSKAKEVLAAEYLFSKTPYTNADDDLETVEDTSFSVPSDMPEDELALTLVKQLKLIRAQEIGRKQTLLGPHRDDISFQLNGVSASSFASQGQQRSLVLSLKLAELDLIAEKLGESPIMLLDDVLAELDVERQGLLMSALNRHDLNQKLPMQTIITTTHLSRFEPEWLAGATVYTVAAGAISAADSLIPAGGKTKVVGEHIS